MDRRTFLLAASRWLALAALAGTAPALSGCGRLLRWSDSETSSLETAATTPATASVSSTSTIGAPSSTAVTATQTTLTATITTARVLPDLAVVTGEQPGANVRAAVEMMGGMSRFVNKGAKVVVKPNVLTGRPPETATTTNPEVMAEVIRMCWEAGAASVTVFDNPTVSARPAFETCGLAKAADETGAMLKYLSSRDFQDFDIPEGKAITSWPLVTEALEADVLINIPIAKAHSVTTLTLSMKNLMGIMGGRRGSIHSNIATKLVDLNTLVKPQLVILDAYRMLFRNGPTGGNPADVKMPKTVVVGTNQVSVDAYGASFFDMKPADVEHIAQAYERGLGEIDLGKLNIEKATA
jgi:uncharacterized protein (DUF362 family)